MCSALRSRITINAEGSELVGSTALYGAIVPLVIIAVLLIIIVAAVIFIKVKMSKFSQEAFGTKDFFRGVKEMERKTAETPRSIRSMTQIYLPQIHKDFPEFDYALYAEKTRSVLLSYCNAITAKDASALKEECSPALVNHVTAIIESLNERGYRQSLIEPVIHGVEIARYLKNGATVTILFNAAVGLYDYIEDDKGKVVFGSRDTKKQALYEIELVYIQDVDKLNTDFGNALGVHCPNCGAPVKTIGQKYCEYCGSGIMEINTRSWTYDAVYEQTNRKKPY